MSTASPVAQLCAHTHSESVLLYGITVGDLLGGVNGTIAIAVGIASLLLSATKKPSTLFQCALFLYKGGSLYAVSRNATAMRTNALSTTLLLGTNACTLSDALLSPQNHYLSDTAKQRMRFIVGGFSAAFSLSFTIMDTQGLLGIIIRTIAMIPLGGIIIYILFSYLKQMKHTDFPSETRDTSDIISIIRHTVGSSVIALLVWIIEQLGCNSIPTFVFVICNVIWHIAMFNMSLHAIIMQNYINNDRFTNRAKIKHVRLIPIFFRFPKVHIPSRTPTENIEMYIV